MRIRRTLLRSAVIRFALATLILVIMGGMASPRLSIAQPANLLQNPSFEGQYAPFNNDVTRQVAPGWSAWNVARRPSDPGYFFAPEYRDAEDNDRVRTGESAQELFAFYATYTGGVFQRVSVTPGARLRFSTFINIWSSSVDRDPNAPAQSEQPSRVKFEVGIDPTGGINGESGSITWTAVENVYDQYSQVSVEATAAGSIVTVFVKSSFPDPVPHNHTYVDDAELVVVQNAPPTTEVAQLPSATPSLTPSTTNTEAVLPTLEPTATTDGATLVPVVTLTPSNTTVPSNTPSNTPLPTNTNTPIPGIPTREGLTPGPSPTRPTATPSNTRPPATIAPTRDSSTATRTNTPFPSGFATPTLTVFGTVAPNLPGRLLYTVRAGDTLTEIAAAYGSTVQAIVNANGLNNAGLILIGQQLVIPVPSVPGQTPIPTFTPFPIVTSPATAAPGVTSTAPVSVIDLRGPTVNGIGTYIVLPGDNFEAIARRYGVTVQTLAALNGILNPRNIVIGQVLAVPGPGNNVPGGTVAPTIIPTVPGGSGVSGRVHVVQVGDNLFRISLRYGVTIEALLRANNLANANLIYVGQRLRIP